MTDAARRTRILLVEDDRSIAVSLDKALEREGCEVQIARDAQAGMALFANYKPDLVILDWTLPDKSGLDVLVAIRELGRVPVLFVTARDEIADKVLALELGADDYLTKPFHTRELVARVRSLLRRAQPAGTSEHIIRNGPIEVNLKERRAMRDGEALDLTRTEFDLLVYLMRNSRVVLTRETLLDAVWGYTFEGFQRTVDAHIRRLRTKLEPEPENPRFIHTVRGVGYRFEPDLGRTDP